MKFLPLVFLLFAWSPFSMAQSAAPSPQSKDKINIKKRYNKSKQITTIQTETIRIHGPRISTGNARVNNFGLSMMASYSYPGTTPVRPESVTLTFMSTELSEAFDHKRDLIITADGEVFRLGKMDYWRLPVHIGIVEERLSLAIPSDVFMRIANAKNAHAQLGEDSFNLREKHLKNLWSLAASISRQ
jgi:hypothetical protein